MISSRRVKSLPKKTEAGIAGECRKESSRQSSEKEDGPLPWTQGAPEAAVLAVGRWSLRDAKCMSGAGCSVARVLWWKGRGTALHLLEAIGVSGGCLIQKEASLLPS